MIQCNDYNSVRNTWDLRKNLFFFFFWFLAFHLILLEVKFWTKVDVSAKEYQQRGLSFSFFPSVSSLLSCLYTNLSPWCAHLPTQIELFKKLPHYTPTICCSSKPLRQSVSVPNNCLKHLTVHTNDNDDLKLTNFQFKCPLCAKIV